MSRILWCVCAALAAASAQMTDTPGFVIVVDTPSPPTAVPTPAPDTPIPPTDAPATPAPPTAIPDTLVPDTQAPPTAAPTPAPDTPAPPTIAPTAIPETPAPPTDAPDTPAPPISGCALVNLTIPSGASAVETECQSGYTPYSQVCTFAKLGYRCETATCSTRGQWEPNDDVICFATGQQCTYLPLYEAVCDGQTAPCLHVSPQFAVRVWTEHLFVNGANTIAAVFEAARADSPLGDLIMSDVCVAGYKLNEQATFVGCDSSDPTSTAAISGQLCIAENTTPAPDTTAPIPETPLPPPPTDSPPETPAPPVPATPAPPTATATATAMATATLVAEVTETATAVASTEAPATPAPDTAAPGGTGGGGSVTPTLTLTLNLTPETPEPTIAAPPVEEGDDGDSNVLVIILAAALGLLVLIVIIYCLCCRGPNGPNRQSSVSRGDDESLMDPELVIIDHVARLRDREMGRLPSQRGPKTWMDDKPYGEGEEVQYMLDADSASDNPGAGIAMPAASLDATVSTPGMDYLHVGRSTTPQSSRIVFSNKGSSAAGGEFGVAASEPLLEKEKDPVPSTGSTLPLITTASPRSAPRESRDALRDII